MSACTFFGHRDCPDSIQAPLRQAIEKLILTQNVTTFYVGHQGRFDSLVLHVLRELSSIYPQIQYGVVLAYFPKGEPNLPESMIPEGIEAVHPRFAIPWRNQWMLRRCDHIIAYVTHSWGGAAKYVEQAKRKNLHILFLEP